MVEFRINTLIQKPVVTVVEAFLNPDNMLHYTRGLEKYEIISGGPNIPGSEMLLYFKEKGRIHTMTDILDSCVPGKEYISRVSGEAIEARVKINFEAAEEGTRMLLHWSGKGKIIFLKLFLPFLKGKIRRQAQAEFKMFGELVETIGVDFSAGIAPES